MTEPRTVVETVTYDPHGWNCETCNRILEVGENAYGRASREYGPDPYGYNALSNGGTNSDYDLSSGYTASDWVCAQCFQNGAP